MKVPVYSIAGKKTKTLELPAVFNKEYKPRLIKRAVVALDSNSFQPHGVKPGAGMDTSAEYIGRRRKYRATIGTGDSHLPRTKPGGGGRGGVRKVPQSVGGRRAHPPKVEKILVKKINKKEKRAAIQSCIAATANKKVVQKRGYKLEENKDLPIIIEDSFQKITKTKEALETLEKLGLKNQLTKKQRIVVITENENNSCKNIPGIIVAQANSLNAGILAPGTHAGVLTVWTEKAIKMAGEVYGD
ncbi:50S ribosomal protein L4 [archaeon]|nr:50S ribosomal protein L4 [archaeon]